MQTYARGLRIIVIIGHVTLCAPNSEDDQELLLQVSSVLHKTLTTHFKDLNEPRVCQWGSHSAYKWSNSR